jgi:serine/threonine protein kinase
MEATQAYDFGKTEKMATAESPVSKNIAQQEAQRGPRPLQEIVVNDSYSARSAELDELRKLDLSIHIETELNKLNATRYEASDDIDSIICQHYESKGKLAVPYRNWVYVDPNTDEEVEILQISDNKVVIAYKFLPEFATNPETSANATYIDPETYKEIKRAKEGSKHRWEFEDGTKHLGKARVKFKGGIEDMETVWYQDGGIARKYVVYSDPNDGSGYDAEAFVKASVKGDFDTNSREGVLHRYLSEKIDSVPKLFETEVLELGDGKLVPLTAMEMKPGIGMEEYIRQLHMEGRDLTSNDMKLIKKMIEVTAQAHDAGIVHRDLKPSNFMKTSDEDVTLLDFGISSPKGAPPLDKKRVAGSENYMSVERYSGQAPDLREDIYALSCIIYEMMIGKAPYTHVIDEHHIRAKESDDISKESIARELPHLLYKAIGDKTHKTASEEVKKAYEKASEKLTAVIDKGLEREPENRYNNCHEMLYAVEEAIKDLEEAEAVIRLTQTADEVFTSVLAEGKANEVKSNVVPFPDTQERRERLSQYQPTQP